MDAKVKAGKPLTTQPSMTFVQLQARFATEDDCKAFVRDSRWPTGVQCPRCGNPKVAEVKKRPWHWQCRKCAKDGYRFSVTAGTVFENTKYPLRLWFQVAYLMCQSKKGISALQIHRQIGSGDYRTAWFLCHRIRAAMKNTEFGKLMGEVEADETWIGGKDKNRHWHKRSHAQGGHLSNKTMVIGAISRKGNVVCQVIEEAGFHTLNNFVREAVSDKVTLVATDENPGYRHLTKAGLPHDAVNHGKHEYVRGNVHTNTIEGFWSLLKRGIVGTFHQVGKEYLPLYVNEFAFRHNHREDPDIFQALISRV